MTGPYSRRCTTCGNDTYASEELPGLPIPLARRFKNYVLGSPLPSREPPRSLRLCIASDNRSDTHRRWFRCLTCDARYISEFYEEVSVSHDRDGDIRDIGYCCDVAEYERSVALARLCPRPDDDACTCPGHATSLVTKGIAWRIS